MNKTDYGKVSSRAYDKVVLENDELRKKNKELKKDVTYYKSQLKTAEAAKEKIKETTRKEKEKLKKIIDEKDGIIEALKNKLAQEIALKGHDGTNTGLPTSMTPIGKKKIVPNSRTKTGLHKGGQKGHKKHTMTPPDSNEVNETVDHKADENTVCTNCGSKNYTPTGKIDRRYELDIEIKAKWVGNDYYEYRCNDCGETFYVPYEPNHKAECQYGPDVQATILSLANTGNVPMNKVKTLVSGFTGGKVNPSEGYIAKLQKRASKGLTKFKEDLKQMLVRRPIVYWDDTVINIQQKRSCLRFYGDELISYYTAHATKGMEGLDEDKVLALLSEEIKVMHDHNKVNYNPKWAYKNLECNQHLERDLQKACDDSHHETLLELKLLISSTIHARKKLIEKGINHFEEEQICKFNKQVDEILNKAWKKNADDPNTYGADFERTLITRIRDFKENYFAWVEDFSLPTTDNLSERALRTVKSHMKISGQFESVKTAGYYADIKTYIETCRKNNINEFEALKRLCSGNPITMQELFPELFS